MMLNWQGNTQVKAGGSTPLTSQGPSLASFGTSLYSAYVGQGGKNIWLATQPASEFPNFAANEQILVPGGSTPLSSFRPALAVFNGKLHMVYAGAEGAYLWWSWFDGNAWSGNLQLPWSGYQFEPTLAVLNNQLHLVWHNSVPPVYETNGNNQRVQISPGHEYILHASLDGREPLQVSSWQGLQTLGDGAQLPALAEYNNALYLILSPTPVTTINPAGQTSTTLSYQLLISKWQGGAFPGWKPFTITGSNPLSAGGAALAVFNNLLYIVYPGQGGRNLWYACIDTLDVHAGNIQIKTSKSTPETSASVGLAAFNGQLCLAYKGQSSDNFWFCYAS